jgi:hypothetical protein
VKPTNNLIRWTCLRELVPPQQSMGMLPAALKNFGERFVLRRV